MAKVERFEDLKAWQKARELANMVYDLTEQTAFAKDFRLRNQIQGTAGSVMHSIAEGFDSGSDPEFIRFLKIARRSTSTSRKVKDKRHRILHPKPRNSSTVSSATCVATTYTTNDYLTT